MNRSLPILIAALLGACATDPRPDTPSGNLEITVSHVRPDCVHEVMANAIAAHGYPIKSTQDGRIIAGRLRPEDAKEERLTVLFLPQPAVDGLKVIIYGDLVAHPGTPYESLQPTRPSQIQQDKFNAVKQKIQSNCGV